MGMMESLKVRSFVNRDKNDAEALHTLAQECENVDLEGVFMVEAEEKDAAKALHLSRFWKH